MSHGRGPGRLFTTRDHRMTRTTKQLLKMLWGYLGKYYLLLLFSGLLILISTVGSIISPIIISEGIDTAIPINTSIVIPDIKLLGLFFYIFLILSLLIWLTNALNTYILAQVRANMLHDVRKDVFNRLVHADMSYHKKEQSGNVTSRVTSDTDELANGISIVTQASSQLLLTLGTFFILLVTNLIITGIALLSIPVAALLAKILGGLGRKIMYRVRRSYGEVSGQMAESLAGVSIAKSFNREGWSSNVLYELNQQTYKFFKQLGALFNFLFPAVSVISSVLVSLALIVGGWLTPSVLTFGSVYLGTILVQRFLQPILHISMFYPQLQSSLAAMDRIADVLEQKAIVTNKPNALPLKLTDSSVTFDNLTYEYIEGIPVLENVSFKVNGGEKIAIVGHTGAGKTTLAALISRFYDPTRGRILIDDQDLRDITLESLHSVIGIIPQEPYLFADTVIENIRYGNPEITNGEIFELCKLIGADDFIEVLPNGYETQLLESGKGLSSGQRQMITIARTMLADPKILVLDEATSRLDAYSESLVQLAQHALFKGRTTFVIAHRLTTIKDVDRIAVFEMGKLVELGTHKELLAQEGVYAELYRTYYAHQGIEDLTKVYMAPQEEPVFDTQTIPAHMQGMTSVHDNTSHDGIPGAMGSEHGSMDHKQMIKIIQKRGITPEEMHDLMKESEITPEKMQEMMQTGSMNPEEILAMFQEQGVTPEEKRKKMKGKGSK
ncbi:MAG: ABC transporter ATP-binding protein [Candidatus Hodarchaeota archaeon]